MGECAIVGVTAYISTEAVQKCFDSGMDEVGNNYTLKFNLVHKPLTIDVLQKTVDFFLQIED